MDFLSRIPDAPWIRDAEINGPPTPDPVYCPECGEECETIYRDRYGNIFGCEKCIETQESYEWAEEERMASLPDWDGHIDE